MSDEEWGTSTTLVAGANRSYALPGLRDLECRGPSEWPIVDSLVVEQPLFRRHTAALRVPGYPTASSEHTMAGDEQRQSVGATCTSDRAAGRTGTDLVSELTVCFRFAGADSGEARPDGQLKRGADRRERNVKTPAMTIEVLSDLLQGRHQHVE